MGIDCSNSVNYEQVEMLSYNNYSLLFLLVGIEPAKYSTQKHFPTKCLIHHTIMTFLNNSEWIFWDILINQWDTPNNCFITTASELRE